MPNCELTSGVTQFTYTEIKECQLLHYGISNRYLRLPERVLRLELFNNNDFAFFPTKYRNATFLNTFFINNYRLSPATWAICCLPIVFFLNWLTSFWAKVICLQSMRFPHDDAAFALARKWTTWMEIRQMTHILAFGWIFFAKKLTWQFAVVDGFFCVVVKILLNNLMLQKLFTIFLHRISIKVMLACRHEYVSWKYSWLNFGVYYTFKNINSLRFHTFIHAN